MSKGIEVHFPFPLPLPDRRRMVLCIGWVSRADTMKWQDEDKLESQKAMLRPHTKHQWGDYHY